MFEIEFPALLGSGTALQSLLGNSISPPAMRADGTTGIFPGLLPEQVTMPAVEWHVVSDRSNDVMEGVNALSSKRVQLNSYATGYLACKQVAREICTILGGYRGGLILGGYLSSVIRNGVSDVFEEKPYLFRAIVDYSMLYTDTSEGLPPPPPGPGITIGRLPFTGVQNGVNRAFTIPFTPPSVALLLVVWNGLLLTTPGDYTISGPTITLTQAPAATDNLAFIYL